MLRMRASVVHLRTLSQLVNQWLEPSQPHSIISGLETNVNASPTDFALKPLNRKILQNPQNQSGHKYKTKRINFKHKFSKRQSIRHQPCKTHWYRELSLDFRKHFCYKHRCTCYLQKVTTTTVSPCEFYPSPVTSVCFCTHAQSSKQDVLGEQDRCHPWRGWLNNKKTI